jgi:FkbM family methyltransferase
VFSFEALSDNYDVLTRLVLEAGADNVAAYRAAIGSRLMECEIAIPHSSSSKTTEIVKMTTLDDLHRGGVFDRLNFIRCDLDGGELDVIVGGLELIRSQVPGLLITVSKSWGWDVFEILQDLGYRAFVPDGQLIETKEYREGESANYFFLHPRSAAWARR